MTEPVPTPDDTPPAPVLRLADLWSTMLAAGIRPYAINARFGTDGAPASVTVHTWDRMDVTGGMRLLAALGVPESVAELSPTYGVHSRQATLSAPVPELGTTLRIVVSTEDAPDVAEATEARTLHALVLAARQAHDAAQGGEPTP